MKTETQPRERKTFWAVHDGEVFPTEGFSCAPYNPRMWWCPKIAYTLTEGHHLFATQPEAKAKAILELQEEIRKLTSKLEKLTA
jgi:hypothetical protein